MRGCTLPLEDVIYYVGHESVVHRALKPAMPHWQEAIYAFMLRNGVTVAGFFSLPDDGVVEIGRIIEL